MTTINKSRAPRGVLEDACTRYISPKIQTPFNMSHTVRGRPFMVQRNGLAMVWLK